MQSYNGWPASPDLKTRVITPVPGVSFRIVDNDNVAAVFTYLAQQYDKRVEKLEGGTPDDWGFAYRADRNDPSSLSCHASGTAVDFNATKHPNGNANTFSAAQLREMRTIIAELEFTVQCGQFYHHTIDGMHWEINVPPGHLDSIGAKLRKGAVGTKKPAPAPKPAPKGHTPKPGTAQKADVDAVTGLRQGRTRLPKGGKRFKAFSKAINTLKGLWSK